MCKNTFLTSKCGKYCRLSNCHSSYKPTTVFNHNVFSLRQQQLYFNVFVFVSYIFNILPLQLQLPGQVSFLHFFLVLLQFWPWFFIARTKATMAFSAFTGFLIISDRLSESISCCRNLRVSSPLLVIYLLFFLCQLLDYFIFLHFQFDLLPR